MQQIPKERLALYLQSRVSASHGGEGMPPPSPFWGNSYPWGQRLALQWGCTSLLHQLPLKLVTVHLLQKHEVHLF